MKLLIISIALVLCISLMIPIYAYNSGLDHFVEYSTANLNIDAIKTLYDYVEAMNNRDWKRITELSVDKEFMKVFFENKDNEENNVGLYSITSAKITSLKDISPTCALDYTKYKDDHTDLVAFLVGLNTSVTTASKYFFNGYNIYLMVLAQQVSGWEILEFSQASIEEIATMYPINERGDDVDKVINALESRKQGIFVDLEGNILEINRATKQQIDEESGIKNANSQKAPTASRGIYYRPSNLRYRLTAGLSKLLISMYGARS